MSNSEWEEQQEASRLIEKYRAGEPPDERSKYESHQPSVTPIQSLHMAENLIVKGHRLLRVEQNASGTRNYIFAGNEAAKTTLAFAEGKLSIEESPRAEAARKYASQVIRAAELEHEHQKILR